MKAITYIVEEHDETGIVGLTPEGIRMHDQYIPTSGGNAFAHDLLEHQNGFKSIGTIRDEIEAMGALAYVRGPYGTARKGSWVAVDESIRREVVDLIDPLTEDDERWHRLHTRLEPDTQLERDPIIDWVLEEIESSHELHGTTLMANIERLLNRGYMKAERRFKDQGWATDLFFHMTDTVDEVIKREGLEEGMRFRLLWKLRGCHFYPVDQDQWGTDDSL
jgi:hypothetical protein